MNQNYVTLMAGNIRIPFVDDTYGISFMRACKMLKITINKEIDSYNPNMYTITAYSKVLNKKVRMQTERYSHFNNNDSNIYDAHQLSKIFELENLLGTKIII